MTDPAAVLASELAAIRAEVVAPVPGLLRGLEAAGRERRGRLFAPEPIGGRYRPMDFGPYADSAEAIRAIRYLLKLGGPVEIGPGVRLSAPDGPYDPFGLIPEPRP